MLQDSAGRSSRALKTWMGDNLSESGHFESHLYPRTATAGLDIANGLSLVKYTIFRSLFSGTPRICRLQASCHEKLLKSLDVEITR